MKPALKLFSCCDVDNFFGMESYWNITTQYTFCQLYCQISKFVYAYDICNVAHAQIKQAIAITYTKRTKVFQHHQISIY